MTRRAWAVRSRVISWRTLRSSLAVSDMLLCKYNSYQYSQYLTDALKKSGLSDSDIAKVRIWQSWYPGETGKCEGRITNERLVIENDDHDQQKPGSSSRDMHGMGSVLVIEKDDNKHRNFGVYVFCRTDRNWKHRLLLSSYTLRPRTDGNDGFPDGLSDCKLCISIEKVICYHAVTTLENIFHGATSN